jgi:hypothetical protein
MPCETPFSIFTFDAQGVVLPGADAHENGIVALISQGLDGEVFAQTGVVVHVDAEVENAFDLPVQHLVRQPVFRDAVTGDAAQFGHGFVNGRMVAQAAQEIGTADAGRSAADDGNAFAGIRRAGDGAARAAVHFVVGHEALELVDGHRLVLDAAAAVVLAGMGQTRPQESSKGLRSRMVLTAPS